LQANHEFFVNIELSFFLSKNVSFHSNKEHRLKKKVFFARLVNMIQEKGSIACSLKKKATPGTAKLLLKYA